MRIYKIIALFVILPFISNAQIITTIAGGGTGGDGGPANTSLLSFPFCGSFDTLGNFYFGQSGKIGKVDNLGIIHTVAGTGVTGFSGDGGMATAAKINTSCAVVADKAGNYIFS
jgi:hypothetical protein